MISIEQKLSYQSMNQEQLDSELVNACCKQKLEIVKYLLTSTNLIIHANIHKNDNYALKIACYVENIEILKYLLNTINTEDIVATYNELFKVALNNNLTMMINFFIFNIRIEKTLYIENYFDGYNTEIINDLFEKRKLEEELQEHLKIDNLEVKRKKIKI